MNEHAFTFAIITDDHATKYIDDGHVVMPLKPLSNIAHPMLGWGYRFCTCTGGASSPLVGTTDKGQIHDWLHSEPFINLGVVTGQRSRLLDIEIDNHGATSGYVNFELWRYEREREGKRLLETIYYRSPSGGLHRWYLLPEGLHVPTNTTWLPGVDVKACGGEVAVPPSIKLVKHEPSEDGVVGTEATGRYEWLTGRDCPITRAPDWLIEDVITRHENVRHGGGGGGGAMDGDPLPPTQDFIAFGLGHISGRRNRDSYRLALRLWTQHNDEATVVGLMYRVWESTDQSLNGHSITWGEVAKNIAWAREKWSAGRDRDRQLDQWARRLSS